MASTASGEQTQNLSSETGKRFVSACLSWTVQDFIDLLDYSRADEADSSIRSETFHVRVPNGDGREKTLQFYLKLNWNHSDDTRENQAEPAKKEFVGLFLYLKEDSCVAKQTLHVLDPHGKSFTSKTSFPRKFTQGTKCCWGWSNFANKVAIEAAFAGSKHSHLKIQCDLNIMTEHPVVSKTTNRPSLAFLNLGEKLLCADDTKDVTLVASAPPLLEEDDPRPCPATKKRARKRKLEEEASTPKTIQCHKLVLTTRSEVFAAMFNHSNTAESQSNTVNVADVQYSVLKEFVAYLYMDTCATLEKDPTDMPRLLDLLLVADKYDVASLKHRCEAKVTDCVSLGNVAKLSKFADKFLCESPKRVAVDFMAGNFDQVVGKPWFAELSKDLRCDVLEAVGKIKQKTA